MSTMQTFDVDKDGYLNFVEFCSMMKACGMEFNGDDDGIWRNKHICQFKKNWKEAVRSIESIFQIGVFESYPGVPVLSSCKL